MVAPGRAWTYSLFPPSLFTTAARSRLAAVLASPQGAGFRLLARSFGADDGQIFWTLAFPSSVPFLVAGLRLGAGRALVGVVVAELYAANRGLGYLIAYYGSTFQTDKLFVAVLIITTMGVFVDSILRHLERRFELWRRR